MSRGASTRRRSRPGAAEAVLVILLPLLFARPPAADGCGPYFPNRLLEGDVADLAILPEASIAREMAAHPWPDPGFRARPPADLRYGDATAAADREDALEAIREGGAGGESAAQALEAYGRVAAAARAGVEPVPAEFPSAVPDEFRRYLAGAAAWHDGRAGDARSAWAGLLDRPAGERKRRSVWAAYMIARSLETPEPELAGRWYSHVRDLARAGFADRLGLAAASLGREAKTRLALDRPGEAVRLYAVQYATGDPTALVSLQIALRLAFEKGLRELLPLAGEPATRPAVTLYVLSGGGDPRVGGWYSPRPEAARAWFEAVEAAGATTVEEADRLAWACYREGEVEAAERWVGRAPDTRVAAWVRSRLLLRAGRLREAEDALARLVARFPAEETWDDLASDQPFRSFVPACRIRAELGVLRYVRKDYEAALADFLDAGYWQEAAWVAERILDPDALLRFVAGRKREHAGLRALLARRLARLGRRAEAMERFEGAERERFRELTAALAVAEDRSQPREARARAGWEAARLTREHGLELLGTELEPDWACFGGEFELPSVLGSRLHPDAGPIRRADPEEIARAAAGRAFPEKRWHYRYLAADLAFEAAERMPDEDEETARVLVVAGGWLKARDPEAADRFYKALVRRCGTTALGKAAERLRWFPPLDAEQGGGTGRGRRRRIRA